MGQFVLKNITMTLNGPSITAAIKEVRDFKKILSKAVIELVKELTDKGVEVAQVEIASMGAVDTSTLIDSIMGWYDEGSHIGHIYTDLDYAVLVEYGTGIVGEGSPHPGIGDDDWINPDGVTVGGKTYSAYDQNEHGEAGWWYPSPNGWYIPKDGVTNEEGLSLAWTKGMPSRPFMYETLRWLEQNAPKIASEVAANA